MKWDYDKLFAVGNVIGIKYLGKISNDFINENDDRDYLENLMNENLADEETTEEIQYIIRLDEHGNVIEHLFDRDKDMPKPFPKLETGMYVETYDKENDIYLIGIVVNGQIVYREYGWDTTEDLNQNGDFQSFTEYYITRVWKESLCFDDCENETPIWERK